MDALEQVFAENPMQNPILHLMSEEAIRERAYEIYERRGRHDGRAEEDWFEAESELRKQAQDQQAILDVTLAPILSHCTLSF